MVCRPNPVFIVVPLILLAGSLAAGMFTGFARAAGCDKYASPSGSDSHNGSSRRPYRTPVRLDSSLRPGQTGCLEAGSYGNTRTDYGLDRSGTSSGQITITAAPGAIITIKGRVRIEGSYTTLSGLNIDGSNDLATSPAAGTNCPHPISGSLEIDGHNDVFENNDFYQSIPSLRSNGIGVGWNGQANHTIIRHNRIHDLGQCKAYDQMIYLSHGNGVQIYDNWMWNDPHGWGVQIYPAATNAHVYNNVIDGAGSGFVVGGSSDVSGNTIDHNVVMNSTGLTAAGLHRGVGISTCCGIGPGNTFTNNDSYRNPGGIANASVITVSANTTSNPALVDPQAHNYSVASGSPLAGWRLWNGNPHPGPALAPAVGTRDRRHASSRVSRHKRRRHTVRAHNRRPHAVMEHRRHRHPRHRRHRRAPARSSAPLVRILGAPIWWTRLTWRM